MNLRKAPIVYLLLPFIVGITISIWYWNFYIPTHQIVKLFITLFSACLILLFIKKKLKFKLVKTLNFLLYTIFFGMFVVAGFTFCQWSKPTNKSNFFGLKNNLKGIHLEIKTVNEGANSIKLFSKVTGIINDSLLYQNASGGIVVYLPIDSQLTSKLKPGYKILLRKNPQEVKSNNLPGVFNYKAYLNHQGYTHFAFAQKNDFVLTDSVGNLMTKLADFRTFLLQEYKQSISNSHAYSIIAALLVGYKDDISDDLKTAYVNTGVVHILAVSGLHVGIIFMVMLFFLKPLNKIKKAKILVTFFVLMALWGYALITGLSPSVFRASSMFSIVLIAQQSNRNTSIFNSIAISAFILLIYDPFILTQVGFLLSYFAVLGIILFFPIFSSLVVVKTKIAKYFWDLFCVSLSAQLAVFPISLYFFHQFPTWFFIANLVVIPITTLILISTLACLPILLFKPAFIWFTKIPEYLAIFQNYLIGLFDNLPYATIYPIVFKWPELIGFSIMLICLALIYHTNSKKAAYLLGLNFFILGVFWIYNHVKTIHNQEVHFVKSKSQNSYIIYKNGFSANILIPNNQLDTSEFNFTVIPYLLHHRVSNYKITYSKSPSVTWRLPEPLFQKLNSEGFVVTNQKISLKSNF